LGIDIEKNFVMVSESEQEILYIKKENGLLNEKQILKIQRQTSQVELEDFDQTARQS
jgi:hypothetical protein